MLVKKTIKFFNVQMTNLKKPEFQMGFEPMTLVI